METKSMDIQDEQMDLVNSEPSINPRPIFTSKEGKFSKGDFDLIKNSFDYQNSMSSCAINLINSKIAGIRTVHERIKSDSYTFLMLNHIARANFTINDSESFWDWYIEKRVKDIYEIAKLLGINPNSSRGYKTIPEYALYFVLLFFYFISDISSGIQRPSTKPYLIMYLISIINPLILDTFIIREIINMLADINKKYKSGIKFEYVCDKRGQDIDYTCGRYMVFNELTNTIEIMQTVSSSNMNVLDVDVNELKETGNIATQFTTNCNKGVVGTQESKHNPDDMDWSKKYLKYKKKYIELSKKISNK